jgi:histidine triad (HIT) family protein
MVQPTRKRQRFRASVDCASGAVAKEGSVDPDCLFCRMIAGEVEAPRLLDDDQVFAIRDIAPQAPVHDLIIPKRHIPSAQFLTDAEGQLLVRMFQAANEVARMEGIDQSGYRCAFNVGPDADMSIRHLHLHVLGGHRLRPEG